MSATIRNSGFAPRRRTLGWLAVGATRGMATGALYPAVVALGLIVFAAYRWIDPPELPAGTITSTSATSPQELVIGAVSAVAYLALLTGIASTIGSLVGTAVGAVAGALCALVDAATRRDLAPNVVGLIGAFGYVLAVVAVVADGDSDAVAIAVAMGPAALAAVTLRIVPIRFSDAGASVAATSPPHEPNQDAELFSVRPGVRSGVPENLTLRPARDDDGDRLRGIERAAGERFREVGLAAIADDEPMSVEQLGEYAAAGRSFVAELDVDGVAQPVGYVLVDVVDGHAHIEQITVDPGAQGLGIGRALIDHVDAYAEEHRLAAPTLTTFRDVAWNAPLYEHLGFRVLTGDEIGPELAVLVSEEAAHGLDPDLRVCMRRELRPDAPR